jgi:hypothetical protein
MSKPCGCCEGTSKQTPVDVSNRPGLSALNYRVGTHPTFLETMKADLSDASNPENDALLALTTRDGGDPAIAMLDAWAVVGDVLTFYQERIANEGYLRTAVERRSVLELARLVGYKARPGVSASVHLAFTLQKDFSTAIPAGTGAKTTPSQGQLPQTFETSEDIDARAEWNELTPRPTRPQRIDPGNAHDIEQIYFDGTSTKLKPNDRLLLVFGDLPGNQVLRKVASVQEDFTNKRTKVSLQLEQFSALAYSIDVTGVLARQLADCPDLANSKAIQALQAAIQPGKPLVADDGSGLDQAVVQALADLQKEAGDPAQSQKNLNALALLAGTLGAAMATLLAKPEATVAANVGSKIAAFKAQDAHAHTVDQLLSNLKAALSGGGALHSSVKAWIDAKNALAAEIAPTGDYKALAAAMQSLKDDWSPKIDELNSGLDKALSDAAKGFDEAIPMSAEPLTTELKGLSAKVKAAQGALEDPKTAALEDANTKLTAIVPKPADPLGAKLDEVKGFVTSGLTAAQTGIDAASNIIGNHPELQISPADAVAIKTVDDALIIANAQLPIKALSDQPAVLNTVIAAIQNGIAATTGLLAKRFGEVKDAITAAPGNTAHDELVALLNASPIPQNFPAGSKEQTHAQNLVTITNLIRAAAAFADVVNVASTGLGQIAAEKTAIEVDANSAGQDQDCIKNVMKGLGTVQGLFTNHFLSDLFRIDQDHRRQLGEIELFKLAFQAIQVLEKFKNLPFQSVTSLMDQLKPVIKQIQDLHAQVLPGDSAQAGWFDAFEQDLNNEIFLATKASLQPTQQGVQDHSAFEELGILATALSRPLAAATARPLSLTDVFKEGSDLVARSLIALQPGLDENLLAGWANQRVTGKPVHIFAFRVKASLFGANAPVPKTATVSISADFKTETSTVSDASLTPSERKDFIFLDNAYDQILNGSWMAVQAPGFQDPTVLLVKAGDPNPSINVSRYGITGKSTQIHVLDPSDPLLSVNWFTDDQPTFTLVRETVIYAQSEELALAEEPLGCPIGAFKAVDFSGCPFQPDQIELGGFFSGLKAGRSVVVSGERLDVPGATVSELADIAGISQTIDITLPGDSLHATLVLAAPLQFGYKRDTVKINANVAHATHGETQKQVLGSGDGTQGFQSFSLSHLPLTYLSAPTASGAQATLQVRVNDVLWHEADNLAGLGPKDRKYIVDIEDDGSTTVDFGDGRHGARLPSGVENVRAIYRNGIGKPGNVAKQQINILGSPPLGVTAVINPDAAAGGADPESRDTARRNAPLAVTALDRLVSVGDFADYARTYAGIAKASSTRVADVVYVTIAGLDDIPIDPASDLFLNLEQSFRKFGDPHQPSQLTVRELLLIVMSAGVAIDPDYEWDKVEAAIRAALLTAFSFDNRDLGQDVMLSEVIRTIQNMPGVVYVRIDKFGAISLDLAGSDPKTLPAKIVEAITKLDRPPGRLPVNPARIDGTTIRPAQIAYISPDLPETVLLTQILPEKANA